MTDEEYELHLDGRHSHLVGFYAAGAGSPPLFPVSGRYQNPMPFSWVRVPSIQ